MLQKGFGASNADRRLGMGTERPDVLSTMLKYELSVKAGRYQEDEKIMSRDELRSNTSMCVDLWLFNLKKALSIDCNHLCWLV